MILKLHLEWGVAVMIFSQVFLLDQQHGWFRAGWIVILAMAFGMSITEIAFGETLIKYRPNRSLFLLWTIAFLVWGFFGLWHQHVNIADKWVMGVVLFALVASVISRFHITSSTAALSQEPQETQSHPAQ